MWSGADEEWEVASLLAATPNDAATVFGFELDVIPESHLVKQQQNESLVSVSLGEQENTADP